ncbi:MAG: glycosyltransferase family 4 protein, partial [Dehalococcoidales bacterium]
MSSAKKVILFRADSTMPGGMERVMFEEAKYFENNGLETQILTYNFNRQVLFSETYNLEVQVIAGDKRASRKIFGNFYKIWSLRKKVKEINPDIIVSYSSGDSMYLYLATMFTPFAYVTHIPQAVSRGYGGLRRYALIYRRALREIAKSRAGLEEFVPSAPHKSRLARRAAAELAGLIEYLAVRKSRKIFVFSNQMKWEVNRLYGQETVMAKGAFPSRILNYQSKQDIRRKLGIGKGKIILSLNRLEP